MVASGTAPTPRSAATSSRAWGGSAASRASKCSPRRRRLAGRFSQIQLGEDIGRLQLSPVADEGDPALVEDVTDVGHVKGMGDVLLDEEHGLASGLQLGDGGEQLLDDLGCQPERQLVDHE